MPYPSSAVSRRIIRRGICVAALMLIIGAADARAALTFQNAASASASSVTTVTIPTFNPGGGGRRVLVVGLTFGQGAPANVIVVYGGAPLTLAPGTSITRGNAHTEIWYLTDPSSTPANIVAIWPGGGSHDVVMGAVAFNGADQTTPVTNGTSANNTGTAISVTVTSAAGDMTLDTVSTLAATLSAPTKNQQWLDTTPATVKGAGSTAAGAASVTHAWTAGSAVAWTASAVNIKAAILGYEVGSFVKTTAGAPTTQVVPHGLGQAPKAILLWTEARQDAAFSGAPIVRAAQAGADSGILTLTINKPAGTLQNDVMGAAIAIRPNTAAITPPAGWALQMRIDNPGPTGNSLAVYGLIAGAAEPASYTFTFSASTGAVGTVFSVSGVDGFNAIDASNGGLTPSSTSQPAPSVTTTSPNDLILTLHTMASAATWSAPIGMTEAADVASGPLGTNGQSLELNYVMQPAVGASGVKTATASNDADVGIGVTFALRTAAQAHFGFGFSDGTTDGSVATSNQDSVATAVTARRMANKVLTVVKWDQTLLAEADLLSWTSASFSLSWTTNDGLPYIVHYMLIGGADVSAKVVNWQMPIATGNRAVAGVGFQPTAVIHIHAGSAFTAVAPATATDSAFGLGVMDFAGAQWATSVLTRNGVAADSQRGQQTNAAIYAFDNTLAVTKRAQFVSMDAGGFTLNFTTAAANQSRVFSLALRGVNVKAGSFLKSVGAAPATNQISGMGFEPSAVLLHSFQDITRAAPVAHSRLGLGASDGTTEGSVTFSDLNAAVPTNVTAIDKIDKAFIKADNATPVVDAEGEVSSLDDDGFTVKWTTNDAVATQILYLGLANLVNTEVRLVSFNATRYPRGVLLQWKTGAELDNLGFNLYREINGVRTKVNRSLVAGSALSAGQGTMVDSALSYAQWDLGQESAADGVTYWLEDLDLNGKITRHGPIVPAASVLNAPEPRVVSSGSLRALSRQVSDRPVFISHSSDVEASRERRAGTGGSKSAARLQAAMAGEAAVKIGINHPGWYRVTQPQLAAAGLSANVDPRNLRLFVEGAEQAILVNAQVAGQFTATDSIEFYATGLDTPYTDTRVYWLTAGAEAGQRIQVEGNPGGAGSAPGRFLSTVRRKDRSVYFNNLKNGDKENWFGPGVFQPDPGDPDSPPYTDLTIKVENLSSAATGTEPLSGTSAQLIVTLQGVTNSDSTGPDHVVGVFVNGNPVGDMAFVGQANYAQAFQVPSYALANGDNVIRLVARGGASDISLVDEIVLTYPHIYRADADLLRATVDRPGPVTIGGFADAAIRVVDITNPAAAIELTGFVQSQGNGLSAVNVRTSAAGQRALLAFSSATVSSPLYVQANHVSNWRDAGQAHDYVLITHADFAGQAAALAEFRQNQGRTPAVVDVNDIYDEFSFGEKTPQAIRDFLQLAKTTWQQAPRFVALMGDATVDPRDYAGLGAADFVPTKQVTMAGLAGEAASDDWFVDFDDNGLPDVAIGRVSVRTASQAETVVSKIVGYEQAAVQPWMKNILLVAGASDDTTSFGQLSDTLNTGVPTDYNVQRVVTDLLGTDAARQAIVDRVNEGQLIVNYAGHGSSTLWGTSSDTSFLTTNGDVAASWQNLARLPFVIAMNCLNGIFNPIFGEDDGASLAEAMQRAPQGGAVAVWASSSSTPPATQALVNQELFRLIFSGAYATLGEAVAAAKAVVTNPDLRKSWIFFGDPATQLAGTPQPTGWPSPREKTPPVKPNAPVTHTPATIDVAANGDLQGAIDRAVPGDTIRLEAGATFVGNFVLPAKSGAGYVTIRSATPDAALPGIDARVGPAQAPLLAKLQSPNAVAALRTEPAAHHYRLLFLEFGPNAKGEGDIIQLGDGSAVQNTLAGVPHDLEIDRSYIHGDAVVGQQGGISLNSGSTTISNSHIADIKSAGVRARAISGWNGPGPYSIVNNFIESAGANLQLGGSASSVPGVVASDVSLRFNYLSKPAARVPQNWPTSSVIELNAAERVTVDGNVFEHNGAGVDSGAALVLMPRSGSGGAPASVAHVRFTNNIVRRAPAGIVVLDPQRTVADVIIRNNLFADLADLADVAAAGGFVRLTGGLDITVDHNTVFLAGPSAVYASGAATIGVTFTNNIVPDNGRAVMGVGTAAGNGTIQRYFPGAIWLGNVVTGAPASTYPTGNAYPESLASIGLVSLAGGNFGLADSSPYRGLTTDGLNPGYDASALMSVARPSASGTPTSRPLTIVAPPSITAPKATAPVTATTTTRVAAPVSVSELNTSTVAQPAIAAPAESSASRAATTATAPASALTFAPSAQPVWSASPAHVAAGLRPAAVESGVEPGTSEVAMSPTRLEPAAGESIEAPAHSTSPRVTKVELTSDVASPYIAGTTISVTAEPAGGAGPYQYQWRVFDGRVWSLPSEWSSFASLAWTPDPANAAPGIMVGVRSAGNDGDTPEARQALRIGSTPAPPLIEAGAEVKP